MGTTTGNCYFHHIDFLRGVLFFMLWKWKVADDGQA